MRGKGYYVVVFSNIRFDFYDSSKNNTTNFIEAAHNQTQDDFPAGISLEMTSHQKQG